jgi:hypothetical protein
MKSTVEISFTAEAVKYTDSTEESDPVDPDAYKGQMLFHTYSKKNKPAGDKERAPKHEKSGDKKFNKNKDHNNGYKKKNNFHGKKGKKFASKNEIFSENLLIIIIKCAILNRICVYAQFKYLRA